MAEFGYRTLKEASRYLYFSLKGVGSVEFDEAYQKAMDAIIVQKLLPKLNGSRGKLEGLLRALVHYCSTERSSKIDLSELKDSAIQQGKMTSPSLAQLANEHKDGGYFHRSTKKLSRMCRKLGEDQFVSFSEA